MWEEELKAYCGQYFLSVINLYWQKLWKHPSLQEEMFMIIHLVTLALSFRNSFFHYLPWTLVFPCRRIFLVRYLLCPHLKWAWKSTDWTACLSLVIAGLCIFGNIDPLRGFGLFASHNFNSHRSHLVTVLGRPAETAGSEWVGASSAINLFFAAELAPTVWHWTGGSRKRHWMTILSPAAWASEALAFPTLRPNITNSSINWNCIPYA